MIKVAYPVKVTDHPRPYVFVASAGSAWVDRLEKELKAVPKCTLLIPSDGPTIPGEEEWGMWRYRAAWDSDVIAIWFGVSADQEMKLMELGLHIGRYCAGSGARQMVIGVDKGCRFKDRIEAIIAAANVNLQGPWRFDILEDLDLFCKRVVGSVKAR